MKPKRVRIVSVNIMSEDVHKYYEQFIGNEYDVLDISFDGKGVKLAVPSHDRESGYTYWFDDEYEVLEWIDDDSEEYNSIMQGLQEAINGEGITISKDARDNTRLYDWEKEPCKHCGRHKTYQGHDGCLGELDGVANSCCGHGNVEDAYVQFFDGTRVGGQDAIIIQNILKRNKNEHSLDERIKFLKGAVVYLEENIFDYFV